MSMSEAKYKAIVAFLKEWSPAMLADFYEYERNALGQVYLSIEDEYFKENSEEEQIVRFLIEHKELWDAISIMLNGSKLEQTLTCDEKEYLFNYISGLQESRKVILIALSRGFLLEWLYFHMGIGDYAIVLLEGEKINNDLEYGKWGKEFRKLECSRAELVLKYAKYASYYFFYRILNGRILEIVFDWLHSKYIKDCFREEIIEISIDCMGMEDIRSKYMDRCKKKDWKPILKVPKLPLPKEIDTERAQIYFRKAIERGYMVRNDYKYRWKLKDGEKGYKVLLVYFLSRIYCYDCVMGKDWTKGVDPDTSEDSEFKNARILEEMFRVQDIGVTRRKRLDKKAPGGYEMVDELFKE